MVDGRDGIEALDFAAGEAEFERPWSSLPSPDLPSLGLRRSEISTFEA
jgi:hypothetical protein